MIETKTWQQEWDEHTQKMSIKKRRWRAIIRIQERNSKSNAIRRIKAYKAKNLIASGMLKIFIPPKISFYAINERVMRAIGGSI